MGKPVLASIEEESQGHGHARNDFELSQEYQLSSLHSVYRRYLEVLLLVFGWDLFAVYKSHDDPARNRPRASFPVELQIGRDRFDRWRRRIRISVTILICCLVFRLMTVGLMKIADAVLLDMYIFNPTRIHGLSNSSRSQLDSFLSPNPVRSMMPTYYQKLIQQVLDHRHSIKAAYDSIADAASLFEVFISISLSYIFIFVPLTHRKNPLDAPIERFMLDPARELRRIDSATKRYLDDLLDVSLGARLIRERSDQVAGLRPHTFSAKWFHHLYSLSLPVSLLVLVQTSIAVAAFFYALYLMIEKPLCIINGGGDCSYRSMFTASDLSHMVDIVAGTCGTVVIYALLGLVLVCTNIISQLALVQAINEDLNRCLSMLEDANKHSPDQLSLDYNRNQSTGHHLEGADWRLLDDLRAEQEIELCLLKTYVRLVISLGEISRIADFVARIIETVLIVIGCVVLTILVNLIYNDLKIPTTQAILLFNCYFISNPLMLICAYAFAHTIELEKIGWSILAELAIYQELVERKGNVILSRSSERIELLADRWRKLVQSYALSSRCNASRPLGLSMTYGQVLNVDFFVISMVLVLIRR